MLYTVTVNGGLLDNDGRNVFTRAQLETVFTNWSNGNDMRNEDDEVVSIDDLMEFGGDDIWNEEMVEMGDDYVSISIHELSI